MSIRYIIVVAILGALAFLYYHFESPSYVGNWENQNNGRKLIILKNNIAIYQFKGFRDSYGDWSEIKKNQILIRYKFFGSDFAATFESNSGNVAYFDDGTDTTVFTRIEN